MNGIDARLGAMPAEVRDADFALIARTTVAALPQAIAAAAAPGEDGYVSVTLPNGATVGTAMPLADAAGATPEALCAVLETLPAVSAYFAADAAPLAAADASPLSDDTAARTTAAAAQDRFAAGTRILLAPGSGARRDTAAARALDPSPPVRITQPADAAPATVSVWLGDARALSLVIPPGATVELLPAPEPLGIRLDTGIPAIDDMLRLRSAGRITEVATMLGGMSAADALDRLAAHPAAAVVIGYGLLRVEPAERLVDAFAALAERRPDLPDALVLAGEAHARLAQHDRALDRLLRAAAAGLPAYSFGLNYLVDRLRDYAATKGANGGAAQAAAAIAAYAPAMLPGTVLTAYVEGDAPA